MANEIQELLKDIKDERLRSRLSAAVTELRKTKKFGLVFEEHLPELLPIYSAKVRSHARVARRDGKLTETFIVEKVTKGIATVSPEAEGAPQEIPVAELVVVKRFGEAIFPALRHVESVLCGGEGKHVLVDLLEPHHTENADSLAKVKGLCDFAEKHGENFGRIEWIKIVGSQIKRLNVNSAQIRAKVMATNVDSAIDSLFVAHGTSETAPAAE